MLTAQLLKCQCQFGPDSNNYLMDFMKFGTNINGTHFNHFSVSQTMNSIDFGDPWTLTLAASLGWHVALMSQQLLQIAMKFDFSSVCPIPAKLLTIPSASAVLCVCAT